MRQKALRNLRPPLVREACHNRALALRALGVRFSRGDGEDSVELSADVGGDGGAVRVGD